MTRCFPEVPVRRWTLNILQALDIVSSAKFQKFIGPPFALGGAWKSRSSRKRKQQPWRPALPAHIRQLIVEMAKANPTWGEQRTANELKLKLGIQVSPRTVRKYLNALRSRRGCGQQRWNSFIRNHGNSTVAWPVTSSSPSPPRRIFYVFVAMGIRSRRILHHNVTEHPTAESTIQQFCEFLAFDHGYRFMIHHRGPMSRWIGRNVEEGMVFFLADPRAGGGV